MRNGVGRLSSLKRELFLLNCFCVAGIEFCGSRTVCPPQFQSGFDSPRCGEEWGNFSKLDEVVGQWRWSVKWGLD